ncbi:MAG: hypothetical protein AB3N16_07315 [Flavobacteriaceae bacterium]
MALETLHNDVAASPTQIREHLKNAFPPPLDQECHCHVSERVSESVTAWERYVKMAQRDGVFETLRSIFPQLHFPIEKNISQTPPYRAVTLKGLKVPGPYEKGILEPTDRNSMELLIHDSIAGQIPVLKVGNETDFKTFIRCFSYRNEPVLIPNSMGAALIKGINNWDRIKRYRETWMVQNKGGDWKGEFLKNVLPNRHLYQDQLIILSQKPYSGVPAKHLGLGEKEWLEKSTTIRLQHEVAHLFTLRHYGHMKINVHDELIADYLGITSVLGKFDPKWFLFFMGLENHPHYRNGGRLENYLGKLDPLPKKDFLKIMSVIVKASENVENWDTALGSPINKLETRARIKTLCSIGIDQMALPHGHQLLLSKFNEIMEAKTQCGCS